MHGGTCTLVKRRGRWLLSVVCAGFVLAVPAGPAQATCAANATGVANSYGGADVAATAACPPAYGEPAAHAGGRKTG
jgi:hypothetical protein